MMDMKKWPNFIFCQSDALIQNFSNIFLAQVFFVAYKMFVFTYWIVKIVRKCFKEFGHFYEIGHIWPNFQNFLKFFLFNQFFVPKRIHLLNFTFTAHVEVAFLKLATFTNLAIFGQNLVNFRKKKIHVVFVLTRDTAYKSSNIKTNGKCDFSCPP